MSTFSRAPRGETTQPPLGYEVIRSGGRHFPVRLHLQDHCHPGATAFLRPDGAVVSFAKRSRAVLFLYQDQQACSLFPRISSTSGSKKREAHHE